MSLIVAGRFTTFAPAERAAKALISHGFLDEDVALFFVNPPGMHDRNKFGGDQPTDPGAQKALRGAGEGAAIGAVLGAVVGVAILMSSRAPGPEVSIIAAGVGAYIGSLIGAMSHMRRGRDNQQPAATASRESHEAGVLVAAHVGLEDQADVARILREAGANEVERASGHWKQGHWSDFNPLKAPDIWIPT
jgi:hypothetical protein